ncbi:MAG: leucine-rich repeat domain-containing protein, partial [Rhodobacteraceae bacterium]|nr:leucine-rich repeat domain-containing protein [Paracoccaceae bacterium]
AGMTALTWLGLDNTGVSDLTPLAGMTALTTLWLSDTGVSDLTPLAGMTALTSLWLERTPVQDISVLTGLTNIADLRLDGTAIADLRPVRALRKLAQAPDAPGLTFKDCAAARRDERIAGIAEIEDDAERAQTLFDYLEHWQPPEEEPGPDDLFPVEELDGLLEVSASTPSEAEREERLKRELHRRLRQKARALADAAGNRFARLATRARALEREVAPEFEELDMLGVHLAVEDLHELAKLGREEEGGEAFPEEVTVPLGDVLRQGPGLVMDNDDVALLMDRARRYAGAPAPEADKAAQDAMSGAVAKDTRTMGERLRARQEQVLQSGTPEAAVTQKGTNRSVLWRFAVKAALWTAGTGTSIVAGIVVNNLWGEALTQFVATNWQLLWATAQTYGTAFAEWFLTAMADMREFSPLAEEARRNWKKRK